MALKSIADIKLENVWGKVSPETKQEAIKFWVDEKVLSEEAAEQRADELLFIARDTDNKIIAVSTAIKMRVKLLNDNLLYQYRCFISPKARVVGFDVHLTKLSLQFLEEVAKSEEVQKPIGVFVVVINPKLNTNKINNQAVWRAYKMYFIGFNTKGQPIRVYYFKGTKI